MAPARLSAAADGTVDGIRPSRLPRFDDPAHAGMDPDTTGWWALDVAEARPMMIALGGSIASPEQVRAVLSAIQIVEIDRNVVHLIGSYGGGQRFIGRHVTDFWPPESWPVLVDLLATVLGGASAGVPCTRKISSIAFDDCRLNMSADAENADIVIVSIGGRVADDRSLWALRASEMRYRNLIHHLPFALIQVDSTPMLPIFDSLREQGITDILGYLDAEPKLAARSRASVRVTDANAEAVQLLAADSVERLIGSVEFVFAAAPETAKRVIAAHFQGRRSHAEITKLQTFDGRLLDVQLSVAYPTPPDRLEVTLITLEDVTSRLATEAQLRELQADYSRAARISMLGELATSIAHEVNQPLSAIVTNAETSLRWLARPDPNLEKVGQLTRRTAESGRRASEIVQRIRGMAVPRAPERALLDLGMIVEEALIFLRHEIETRSIELSVRLARHLLHVAGDRVQLQQVIVNLLLNAVQAVEHNAGGSRIELWTELGRDGAIVFAIHDNGPGISDENMGQVFTSFFTTKPDGMGIGLAICQSIIDAHGGTIAADNHPAGGALFLISLPAAAEN